MGLLKSKLMSSEMVVKEFDSVMSELQQLSSMASRFPDFDLAGKRMYIDRLDAGCDRYRVFIKRIELSDDPQAKEYLRFVNAQMLNGGFTMPQMFEGLQQSLAQYRQWVDQEEAASADPSTHQAFLVAFREAWKQSALGRIDMGYLQKVASPDVIMRAQRHPDFYRAIKEISDSPAPEVMRRWQEHPDIGPLVSAMWKSMMEGK